MALKKVGNIYQGGGGLRKVGNIYSGQVQQSQNLEAAQANAQKYADEAKQANSFGGMFKNFIKAVPQATADTLVGTPAKFLASTAEVPETFYKGKASQREYKLPGLSPFKSYQSEAETRAGEIVDNKKPLYAALEPFITVPLAGMETYGLGKAVSSIAGKPLNIWNRQAPTLGTRSLEQAGTKALPSSQLVSKISSYAKPSTEVKSLSNLKKFYPNVLRSGERILTNQGEAGQELSKLIRSQKLSEDLLRGKFTNRINSTLKGLSKEERLNVTGILEGTEKPISKEAGTAAKIMRNWLNKIGRTAEEKGFQMRVPGQKGEIPFKMRENYFPRQYDISKLQKSANKEKILQSMVEKGTARNKAEAEKLLNDFIFQNTQGRAGNLENPRMFDIPGYERDPLKALPKYAQSVARRFTEAEHFGMKDENVANLINKIADKGGDYREAQKIFDYTYKGPKQSKIVNALQQYNLATKLSLSGITNATQSVNTIAKAGLNNTIRGAIKGFTKEGKDLAELAGVYDNLVMTQETNHLNRFVKGVMKPFQIIENFNRRTAANAGVAFAKELAKNPDSAYAIRQLTSLGIDPKKIIAGKLTDNDLLTAANNMARITQFKISAMDVPPSWKSPAGKLLTQFRSFSFMQTKMVRDEILKEAAKGNLAPFVRFIVTAPVASYAAQIVRNKITGRVPTQEEKNIDIRNWDQYLKAIGTIPTDLATQAEFVRSRMMNKYSTPLQNISTVAGSIAGPTVGDFGGLITALENKASTADTNRTFYSKHPLAQRDPNLMLKRYGVSKVPFIGQYLKNTTFAFKPTEAQNAKNLAKQAIEANDNNLFNQALEKDPYLKSQDAIRAVIGKKVKEMSPTEKKFYDSLKEESKKKKLNPYFK